MVALRSSIVADVEVGTVRVSLQQALPQDPKSGTSQLSKSQERAEGARRRRQAAEMIDFMMMGEACLLLLKARTEGR